MERMRWEPAVFNTLRLKQNGRHFPDDIFKCIFLNENAWILLEISLKFVPKGPINNIPALVQIMAWRRPGDKPLSEPMIVSLPTHICVTRPQWVKVDMIHFEAWTKWLPFIRQYLELHLFDPLDLRRCGINFKSVISKLVKQNSGWGTCRSQVIATEFD